MFIGCHVDGSAVLRAEKETDTYDFAERQLVQPAIFHDRI